ncbi:MAG: hypothetical protein R2880_15275 [Deinococcales bacterium]
MTNAPLKRLRDKGSIFEHDMRRDFSAHVNNIKQVLLEVERRGDVFFDENVRLGRLFKLMNSETDQS